MNADRENHLTNEEKNLVAMGAAMGAGCRTCADKLHGTAEVLKIPEGEMAQAFHWGLEAKGDAVRTMQQKVSTLTGDGPEKQAGALAGNGAGLASLVRIASFVAANSAPDALAEIKEAQAQGITPEQIRMCISLAKMVRKNAMAFSDQELSAAVQDPEGGEMCCPLTASSKDAPACSCT